jgi:hypothetical protein
MSALYSHLASSMAHREAHLKELDPAIHQEREQLLPDKLLLSVANTAVIPATWNMQTNNNWHHFYMKKIAYLGY